MAAEWCHAPFHYFKSKRNQTKKYIENLRHMEESSSTDKDSTLKSSQPQLSYNYHNVTQIANEWNTSSSSPEDETHVKTLFQQNVSKQLKMAETIFEIPKTRTPTTTRDLHESILHVEMVDLVPFHNYIVRNIIFCYISQYHTTNIYLNNSHFSYSPNSIFPTKAQLRIHRVKTTAINLNKKSNITSMTIQLHKNTNIKQKKTPTN